MTAPVEDFQQAIEDLKGNSPELILLKAKEAFNHCAYNKESPAHRQCKNSPTDMIKRLKNPNARFVDKILHQDGSITLITSDRFYIKFYNL